MIGPIQELPRCFRCHEQVTHDAIFASPVCEHATCPTAVFHPLCLMEHRQHAEEVIRQIEMAHTAFMRHLAGECDCGNN